MKHTHSCSLLVASILIFCTAVALHATTLAQLSLEQLTSAATVIARARCTGSESRWRDGEIWTVTSFRAEEIWKGNLPWEFEVWILGGRSGSVTSYVPGTPHFQPGEETVLFLEPARSGTLSITAWDEGTFRVRRDPLTDEVRVTQDTASLPTFDSIARRFRASSIRDWPLEKLKTRVQAATAGGADQRRKE
ncbi:MAG TPA: hypothetical protein VGR72_08485 [Candidatus Acidoferrales bacterium]|nr:hypothetical protein [Candidatus Acidoferrales bacterium]